jgi:hypothetical protein
VTTRVTLVNPLEAMLKHYVRECEWILGGTGVTVRTVTTLEPSASGRRPLRWAVETYSRLLMLALLRRSERVILVWPVLGHLDLVLMNLLFGKRGICIVHDPLPLVRSRGHGRVATALARRCKAVSVVVHSSQAEAVMIRQGFSRVNVIPHPILDLSDDVGDGNAEFTVAVVGQYKRDRNLELLEEMASVADGRAVLRVHGRGWPSIAGWNVDQVIRECQVVLIPYKRFYQSGVAVRALELSTPVVGPCDSSLSDMFDRCVGNLATSSSPEEWWARVERARATAPEDLRADHAAYSEKVAQGWAHLLEGRP